MVESAAPRFSPILKFGPSMSLAKLSGARSSTSPVVDSPLRRLVWVDSGNNSSNSERSVFSKRIFVVTPLGR